MKMLKKIVLTFISIMIVTLASAHTAADAKGFYPEASNATKYLESMDIKAKVAAQTSFAR